MDKSKIIKKIIAEAENRGTEKVMANIKGGVTPKSLGYRGTRNYYIPDVVAIYEKHRDIFSVEDKITTKTLPDMISKWILFGLEARQRRGKFYLLVPEKEEESFEEILNEKQISAELRLF